MLQSTGIGAVGEGVPQVFNRTVKTVQRDSLALRGDRHEYRRLRLEIAERLTDKLLDTHKKYVPLTRFTCLTLLYSPSFTCGATCLKRTRQRLMRLPLADSPWLPTLAVRMELFWKRLLGEVVYSA